ncbi:putative PITH domain-containing protein 1 [Nannochloris sp. 'desiccata']|nr:putative PITH domain-containing protein 1 [Chlorella desiccata (nom. nud.)]
MDAVHTITTAKNKIAVRCLNEAEDGSCRHIFKPWDQRLSTDGPSLLSDDDDPELLLHVPFTGSVKLQALTVIGGPNGSSPAKLKVFINRDDLDFSTVTELAPVQEWDLLENFNGQMEYPTQVAKFNGVHSIDLYFPANFGAAATEITFIAFKGEFSERKRQAVEAVYEARPVPSDHKVPGGDQMGQMGM